MSESAKKFSTAKPAFLRGGTSKREEVWLVRASLRKSGLHTVCEEAHCPNLGACFAKKTSTFLILGKVCTRSCRFCAVGKGRPGPADPGEPGRVAAMAKALNLKHVVITSVTRDDLADGGASQFLATVNALRQALPSASIEVLTPDFRGSRESLSVVLSGKPEVFNHNLETVPRLYPMARPGADSRRSLSVLAFAKKHSPNLTVKSGIMAGMGEDRREIIELMKELKDAGCSVLTIGQYLAPSRAHWPVARYYEPGEYRELKEAGEKIGIEFVFAGPLVRSSFNAFEVYAQANARRSGATMARGEGGGF